jgi:membrane fusion protein (multidrug efflux system)
METALGASVDANQTLVEIADPSALDIVLRVTAGDAARIRPGQLVRLSAGESARGESLGTAGVVEVAGAVDSTTRTVSVRVRGRLLSRALRIGETLFGEISLQTRKNVVTVPAQSLVPEGDGFNVFVVDSADIAHVRAVTVGARTDSLVEIVDGLKGGERIVTYGAFGVSDSAKVVQAKK